MRYYIAEATVWVGETSEKGDPQQQGTYEETASQYIISPK